MTRIRSLAGRALRAAKRAKSQLAPPKLVDPSFPNHTLRQLRVPYGSFWLPDGTRPSSAEPPGVAVARQYVQPGTRVIQVGARFGLATVLFSRLVGGRGQVLAFEADRFAYSALLRNLDANQANNVRPFRRSVSGEGGSAAGPEQPLVLDELVGQPRISLLSLDDAEGGLEALRGAWKVIGRHQMPVLFRCDPRDGARYQRYVEQFRALSYTIDRAVEASLHLATPTGTGSRAAEGSTSTPQPLAPVPDRRLCSFLKSRADVETCTDHLHRNGYVSHLFACKDWDLAHIIPEIGDGNFLDMGSSESFVLKNVMLKDTRGDKYGIDLRPPDFPLYGVRYLVGDLMDVPVPDGHFKYLTCLSVIEHQVDFRRFASEASRLLTTGGKLFVTFDYWEPRVTPRKKLYGLAWQPLDREAMDDFVSECQRAGLSLVDGVDDRLGDAVIREGYFSPEKGVRYTFGLLTFEKRGAGRP